MLRGLAALRPDLDWGWYYRPHRYLKSYVKRFREPLPPNAHRALLFDRAAWRPRRLFHGFNQRLPETPFARQVVTFHDLFVMTAEYSTPEFRARFAAQAQHAARTADRIIAVSQFTADQVAALLPVPRERITVIPHGIRALPPVEATREKIVLHVGAIQKRKNLVRLVHAFAALPKDWRLVLAGSSGYGSEQVLDAVNGSSCKDRIQMTGYVTSTELARWYARASVFAFPSLDEGFGMPVLEAMSAGVPVLAANGSAVREVAADAALLVDPLSVDEMAEGLKQLAAGEQLREGMITAGHRRAAEFSWDRACAATLGVYETLF